MANGWSRGNILQARIVNTCRALAQRANIFLNIEGLTNDYDIHFWRVIELAHMRGASFEKHQEVNIHPDEVGTTYIISFPEKKDYCFVETVANQLSWSYNQTDPYYILEMNKEYIIKLRVTGNFSTMKWWFKAKPKPDGEIEFTSPVEIC